MPIVDISLAGTIVSLAILIPSFLLMVAPPVGAPTAAPGIPRFVVALERVGQAGCLVLPGLTAGDARPDGWFAVIVALIAAYYGLWARYLTGGRRFALLYAPLGPLPVPMALLPVGAFLAAAAWSHSWPLAVLATVLAVGHLTTALLIARCVGADGR